MLNTSILISGTTGFVGKHLKAYFQAKFPNIQILELNRSKKESNQTLIWDEIKLGNLPEVSSYVHLAGMAHDTKNTTNEEAYFEINTNLTTLLFERFLASNAKQFIYISSVKAAADHLESVLTEACIPNPQTAYGRSKLAAEHSIERLYADYLSAHPTTEKKYYILRPCMIHGPGNKGNLNLLVNFTNKGIPYPLAAFKNKRSYLSVFNMVFLIAKILERNIPSGIYQLADNESISTNDLIDLISETNHKKIYKLNIPQKGVRFLFHLFDYMHFPIGTEQLDKLVESYQVSNHKILQALGVQLPIATREGLKITINSFKKLP